MLYCVTVLQMAHCKTNNKHWIHVGENSVSNTSFANTKKSTDSTNFLSNDLLPFF